MNNHYSLHSLNQHFLLQTFGKNVLTQDLYAFFKYCLYSISQNQKNGQYQILYQIFEGHLDNFHNQLQ